MDVLVPKLDDRTSMIEKMVLVTVLLWAEVALMSSPVHAQSSCDPLTQYLKDGQCCGMCRPGTRMLGLSTCFDPRCEDCGDHEYLDRFNTESKCQHQPYCDPNKNFQPSTEESTKKRTICRCFHGFHCSSETCLTCIPHTVCKPGEGAVVIGNHSHDTVCQTCPDGSFSTDHSWESVCIKQTECESGDQMKQKGTPTSDNDCGKTPRLYVIFPVVISVLLVAVILLGLVIVYVKRKRKQSSLDIIGRETEPLNIEAWPLETQLSKEEQGTRTPEENIDEGSGEEIPDCAVCTENGNFLKQETGKVEILSLQEESH